MTIIKLLIPSANTTLIFIEHSLYCIVNWIFQKGSGREQSSPVGEEQSKINRGTLWQEGGYRERQYRKGQFWLDSVMKIMSTL